MKMKRIFLPTTELYLSPIYCIAMGARLHGIDVSEAELLTIYPVGRSSNHEGVYLHIAESLGIRLYKESIEKLDLKSKPELYLLISRDGRGVLVDARSVEMPVAIYRPAEGHTIVERTDFSTSDFTDAYLIHRDTAGKIIQTRPSTPHFYTLENDPKNFESPPSTEAPNESRLSVDLYFHYKTTSIEAHISNSKIRNSHSNFCKEYLQSIHLAYFKHFDNQAGIFRSNPAIRNNLPFATPHRIDPLLDQLFENLKPPEELKHFQPPRLAEVVAQTFSDLNAIHPFFNGNGRVTRKFLFDYTKEIGYPIDIGDLTRSENYYAFFHARAGKIEPLKDVLMKRFEISRTRPTRNKV